MLLGPPQVDPSVLTAQRLQQRGCLFAGDLAVTALLLFGFLLLLLAVLAFGGDVFEFAALLLLGILLLLCRRSFAVFRLLLLPITRIVLGLAGLIFALRIFLILGTALF